MDRGPASAASLERSNSCKETAELRTLPLMSGMQRNGPSISWGDVLNFLLALPADAKQLAADQKLPKEGEIKKLITSALGISHDEPSTSQLSIKAALPSLQDEIRRVKSIFHDNFNKASSRVKGLAEVLSAMDRIYQGGVLRKRSRSDVASGDRLQPAGPSDRTVPASGGSVTKMASQSHLAPNGLVVGLQKSDDRSKHGVPNKRVRTSMLDMDSRSNNLSRPTGSVDRDKDMFRLINGSGAVQSDEKDRVLSTSGVDGWEKSKMRKKRSGIKSDASANSLARPAVDCEREPKRGVQQRPSSDVRLRVNATPGFRSGTPTGIAGIGKSDLNGQQNVIGFRSMPRSDQDGNPLLTERRERVASLDKERLSFKASNKSSLREENSAASAMSLPKMTTSARGPRSSSSVLPKSSPTAPRPVNTPEDTENNQFTNRPPSMAALTNRKRSASSCSLSPPVTQWGGQRPQKITRIARRSNHVPPTSMHEEAPPSESTVINGPGTLSESEEVGAAEMKTKDKVCKTSFEVDDKAAQSVPKATTLVLPTKKNKISSHQFIGDGVRRQGRTGRGFTSLRACLPSASEKVDNAVTTKQMRSTRPCSDKIESKSGRPLHKKSSERKGYVRPRHVLNSAVTEFPVESGDDHEELLVAANGALNTSTACSGSFWKKMEPLFRFLSVDDVLFLKQQICNDDEVTAGSHGPFDADQTLKGDLGCSIIASSATADAEDYFDAIANVAKGGELEIDISADTSLPLSWRLCAAIIDSDEMGRLYSGMNGFKMDYDLDADIKCNLNPLTKDGFPVVGRAASNSHRVTASKRYHDELEVNEVVHAFQSDTNGDLSINCNSSIAGFGNSGSICTEVQYSEMCLDDKILLELQSIGLSAELLPGLTQGEDEISEEINRLEDKLREQTLGKEKLIMKLEQAVVEAREVQGRGFERLALDKLVSIAYAKYMACWGNNSGGKSSASKLVKHSVLSFVKRVLTRYHTYEEAGRSCFSEPPFRDMFSLTSYSNDEGFETAAANPSSDGPSPTTLSGSRALGEAQRGDLSSELTYTKDESLTCKNRRREVLINDVGGGASIQGHSGLAGTLSSGTKGKRSERDRDGKAREPGSRNGPPSKVGRQAVGGAKGERKSKSKPKLKMTTHLSASTNGGFKKAAGPSNTGLPIASDSLEVDVGSTKERDDIGLLSEETFDLSHLQLPGMDVLGDTDDLGEQGQDLGAWLNIEDDSLLDNYMGLEIPMDDLSDLNMMV